MKKEIEYLLKEDLWSKVIYVFIFIMLGLTIIWSGFQFKELKEKNNDLQQQLNTFVENQREINQAQLDFNNEVVKRYNLHAPIITNITAEIR